MTKNQRITLMADWWPAACRAQGWNKNDRAKRIEVLSQIVGRHIKSASDLNNTDEVGKVKNHLLMLADNVAATVETDHPEMDKARRFRFVIRQNLQLLGVYHEHPEGVLAEILKDKFQHGARSLVRPLTIDDLTAEEKSARGTYRDGKAKQPRSDLEQVLWSLSRVLSKHRQAAGDTEHAMYMKAGILCPCSQCQRNRIGSVRIMQPVPTPEAETVADPF